MQEVFSFIKETREQIDGQIMTARQYRRKLGKIKKDFSQKIDARMLDIRAEVAKKYGIL